MKNLNFITIILIVLSFGIMSTYAGGQYESKRETVKFENIKELDVSNVTGSINITGWDKDYVEVTYTKKAKYEEDLEEIDIDIEQRGDALYIVTDLPWRCKQCGVNYEINIPKKFSSLAAETVTGSLDFQKIKYVDKFVAHSTTGSINGEIGARDIQANVVTGSVKLYINEIDPNGKIEVETVTGSIKLYVPDDFEADIDFSAVTGSVSTDFDLDRVEVKKKNKLEGSIGKGDITCRMNTVTGSVYLGSN